MGREITCSMRYQRRSLAGKAYLETDYLLFRGEERLKVWLKDLTSVKATAGVLRLEFAGGPAELELGKAAEHWAAKVLHPPSRADKLGIKPGVAVRLVSEFDAEFREDLSARGAQAIDTQAKADLSFYAVAHIGELAQAQVRKLAQGLKSNGALWIIYPKGVPAIRELDVLLASRETGLKDNTVASFSATHTALRFVIPVTDRLTAPAAGSQSPSRPSHPETTT